MVVKVNASDVGVAGSWGEVHTPQSSLTWGDCLPSEIYVKEIREHDCPKLRRRDQRKEPWRRISVKSESLRVVMDRKTLKICPERICSLTLDWGEKREEVKTGLIQQFGREKKKTTAILPKYHYRDKMERFGILSNYKDLQMCIKYIPPS